MSHPAIRSFYVVAKEYCRWAESPPGASDSSEAARAQKLLAALVMHALDLPETGRPSLSEEPATKDEREKLDVEKVCRRFAALPFRHYAEVFAPTGKPPQEPITGDLVDDLRDIYLDLRRGLRHYEAGREADAVFEWRTNFGFHWGPHATGALHALLCHEARR